MVTISFVSVSLLARCPHECTHRSHLAQPTAKASPPIQVKTDGRTPIYLRGAFLDLRLNFAGGRPMSFGPRILLSPRQALAVYAYSNLTARALLPMNISCLSAELVDVSLRAPLIRRGPISTRRARRDDLGDMAENRNRPVYPANLVIHHPSHHLCPIVQGPLWNT